MLKNFLKILGVSIIAVVVLIVHFALNDTLPPPFNRLNLIFAFLVWLITYKKNVTALWPAIFLSFLTELFSSDTFGVNMIALLLCLAAISWFLLNVIIRNSWYVAFLLGFFGIICYRILLISFLALLDIFYHNSVTFSYQTLTDSIIEAFITATFMVLLYFVSSFVSKRFSSGYIVLKKEGYARY